jgi:2-succinyl-6-hydroxy-2,4-cyclohexadiene-1-carboxylate synthase
MPKINLSGAACDYDLTAPKPDFPVLVFVHGWLLSRAYWQPLVDTLSSQYQCLTYDLRGFGRSQPISRASDQATRDQAAQNPYGLQSYAEDLVALLAELQIEQAWLVGHSLGGSIALWAADLAPTVVAGVVCVNAGGGIYIETEFARFRQAGQQLVKFRPGWLRCVPLLGFAFGRMAVQQPIESRWGQQRLIDWLDADQAAARESLLASTTRSEVHRLPHLVAGLKQPVHFIAGGQDMIMAPRYVQHLASFHPLFQELGENVTELDNCGHFAMLEQTHRVAQRIQTIVQPASIPAFAP